MTLTLGQIADWIHAEGEFDSAKEAVGYSIDSRTVGAGELFFAVKGERAVYELTRDRTGLVATRNKLVHGVSISSSSGSVTVIFRAERASAARTRRSCTRCSCRGQRPR